MIPYKEQEDELRALAQRVVDGMKNPPTETIEEWAERMAKIFAQCDD